MTRSSPDGRTAISVEQKFCLSVIESFVASCGRILEFRRDDEEPDYAVIWLLIDHLLLIFQEPVYVTIRLVRNKKIVPITSNLSKEDRLYEGLRPLEDEFKKRDNDAVRIEAADVVASIRYLPREWEKDDRWAGERWSPTGIGDTYSKEAVHELLSLSIRNPYRLSDALSCASSARSMNYNTHFTGARVVTDQEIDQWYIKPLQTRVGTTLDTFSKRLLTSSRINPTLNLFLVAKQPATIQRHILPQKVPSEYDLPRQAVTYQHSAALILAITAQREALREDDREPEEAYYPLQQGERSISDTPLVMGNVDFGLPNETIGNGYSRSYRDETQVSPETWSKMKQRRSHEIQLFNLAFGGKAPSLFSVFYVPIHVHGHPWFAAFTIVAVDDETHAERRYARMMHCLHFYRDVVPEVAGSIARATLEAFGEQLGAAVARNLEIDDSSLIDRVNREWVKIGTMYPYGIPLIPIPIIPAQFGAIQSA